MELTSKNTKSEILEAYEKLLKEVQEAKSNTPKQIQEEKQNKATLKKVAEMTNDSIIDEIKQLRTGMEGALDNLAEKMLEEYKRLEEIRAAIEVEKKNLEDLYELSANTDSLAAMLLAYQNKKAAIEAEQEAMRQQWAVEKQQHNDEEREYNTELQKSRKREEEEYQYNLKKLRQKEQDEYESRKEQQEKELAGRKAAFEQEVATRSSELTAAETELAELRKANAGFPVQLQNALAAKEEEVTKAMEARFEFERQLTQKQNELDNSLKDQQIKLLKEKIVELTQQVKDYADKAAKADGNVKDIALKAIESSGKMQIVTKGGEE